MRGQHPPGHGWLLPALPAVALHAGYHVMAWRTAGGTDLHFFSALSLVGLGMALLALLVGARGRLATLGVVVYPIAAATPADRKSDGEGKGGSVPVDLGGPRLHKKK